MILDSQKVRDLDDSRSYIDVCFYECRTFSF